MSAVESDSLPMGAPGSSLVAYMPHTGLLINDDNFLPEMRESEALFIPLRIQSSHFRSGCQLRRKRAAFRILEEGHGPDRCTVCDV